MKSLASIDRKLPDFLYSDLDSAISESEFWRYANTEDDIDMANTPGGWQEQTPAGEILEQTIESHLKSLGVNIDIVVISANPHDNPSLELPVGPDHKLYPNKLIVGGQQSTSSRGRFIMYLFLLPVSENFNSSDINSSQIARNIGKIVRHEIIHAIQMEKRRKNQKISRAAAKDKFELEGEIPKDASNRQDYLGSKIEIDAYAHEFAEELLQMYGKEKSLSILRGSVPLKSLNLSSQIMEYLENIPSKDSVTRLKKKIYTHIMDLVERGIYSEAKKKKYRGTQPEETYIQGTDKSLYLDKPSTHGGWPEGEYEPKVMKQISDWLKDMNMIKNEWHSFVQKSKEIILEQKGFFGKEFEEFKLRFENGEDPLLLARNMGLKEIGAGSTRTIFDVPGGQFVLKIANPVKSAGFEMSHSVDSNRAEANNSMNTKYPGVFPKIYERAQGYEWIVQEKVRPIRDRFEIQDHFFIYGLDLRKSHLPFSLALDLAATEIRGGDASGMIERFGSSFPNFGEVYRNLKKNRTFNDLAGAIAEFGIDPSEIRPGNVGFVHRDGEEQFVLLDASIFDRSN
jgi:hypothetical protein